MYGDILSAFIILGAIMAQKRCTAWTVQNTYSDPHRCERDWNLKPIKCGSVVEQLCPHHVNEFDRKGAAMFRRRKEVTINDLCRV